MIVQKLVRALDERLAIRSPLRKAVAKVFPDHWTFMFGEIALYSFVALVLTGVFLALFFEPSTADRSYQGSYVPMQGRTASAAYVSIISLSFDVRAGLLMRQSHHWAALVFLGAIVVHLCRIFFTGAFRKPREINWLIGVTMLTLALLNGFTGYSMPDDLLSGTGLRIANAVVLSIPVIGEWLMGFLFGGEFFAEQSVPRMFTTHVFLVPAALAGLIALHLLIIVRQKHTQFPAPGRNEHNVVGSPFWPNYSARSVALFSAVLAVLFALGGVAQINPVWIYGPFDPGQVSTPVQPDWYVAWEEGALRLFPPADIYLFGRLIPSPFLPGVAFGGLTFAALFAVPFVEAHFTRDRGIHELLDRPRNHPVRVAVGVAALAFYSLLVLAAADDIIARYLAVQVVTMVGWIRVLLLIVPIVAALAAYLLARALRDGGAANFGDLSRADLAIALGRRPTQAPAPAGDEGRVELWREPHGRWCWRYVGAGPIVLSGQDHAGEADAIRAARTAYPLSRIVRIEPATHPASLVEKAGTKAWIVVVGAAVWRRLRKRGKR